MCWWSPGPHSPFTAGFWGLRLYNVNRRSKQDPNGLKLDKWNICSAQMLLIFQDVQLREKRIWKVLNCLLNTFIVSALNLDANMPTLKWSGKLLQFWVHSIMWKITSCILSWKVSLIREGSLELNTGSFFKNPQKSSSVKLFIDTIWNPNWTCLCLFKEPFVCDSVLPKIRLCLPAK